MVALALPAHACGEGGQCQLDKRSYAAKLPPGWDGRSPLPVLLHFHGWGRQGTGVTRNKRIADAAAAAGALLIAPDGLRKSWAFWSDDRRDIDFTESVLADVARRWPIDRERIIVSGFSYGSAMAWFLACDQGDRYRAVLGIAGTLPRLEGRDCATGPITIRNVHGEKDTVMRLHGGEDALAFWNALAQCGERVTTKNGRYRHHAWQGCESSLEVHDGGHWIPKGWLHTQLIDLLAGDNEKSPR